LAPVKNSPEANKTKRLPNMFVKPKYAPITAKEEKPKTKAPPSKRNPKRIIVAD
jgi:hypothetical protein